MIAVARQESGARKLEGHDIMALERFDPEVTHMIVFDVLSRESPVGDKGHSVIIYFLQSGVIDCKYHIAVYFYSPVSLSFGKNFSRMLMLSLDVYPHRIELSASIASRLLR